MKNSKRFRALLFIALLFFVGIVVGTIAYFTTAIEVKNNFKALTYDVDITEESDDAFGKKVVNIVNKDEVPVVIRVSYNEIWSKEDSEYGFLTLNNLVNGTNVVDKDWSDTWKEDFVLGDDGWYYYKKILSANSSINLIQGIRLNRDLVMSSPDYEDYFTFDYELNFGFEAIQATPEAIHDLWNLDVVISNQEVKWV